MNATVRRTALATAALALLWVLTTSHLLLPALVLAAAVVAAGLSAAGITADNKAAAAYYRRLRAKQAAQV